MEKGKKMQNKLKEKCSFDSKRLKMENCKIEMIEARRLIIQVQVTSCAITTGESCQKWQN